MTVKEQILACKPELALSSSPTVLLAWLTSLSFLVLLFPVRRSGVCFFVLPAKAKLDLLWDH